MGIYDEIEQHEAGNKGKIVAIFERHEDSSKMQCELDASGHEIIQLAANLVIQLASEKGKPNDLDLAIVMTDLAMIVKEINNDKADNDE